MRFSLVDVVCAAGIALITLMYVGWGVTAMVQDWMGI